MVPACAFFTELCAFAKQVQRMVLNFEFKQITDHGLDLLHAWITEFKNMSAIITDQVVMLLIGKTPFIQRKIFSKLMLHHQAGIKKEFNGIVYGSPAYFIFLFFQDGVEMLDIKMVVKGINFIQNSESFGSFPLIMLFKVI